MIRTAWESQKAIKEVMLFLVGPKKAIELAVQQVKAQERYTLLQQGCQGRRDRAIANYMNDEF